MDHKSRKKKICLPNKLPSLNGANVKQKRMKHMCARTMYVCVCVCVWRTAREEATVTSIRSREHDDGDENNDRNDDAFSIKAGLAREQRDTERSPTFCRSTWVSTFFPSFSSSHVGSKFRGWFYKINICTFSVRQFFSWKFWKFGSVPFFLSSHV